MTDKEYKQLYALFVGVFVLNVAVTLWNTRENHKLRQIQSELAKKQLNEANKKEEEKS